MSSPDLHILAQLLEHHPELIVLRSEPGPGRLLADAAPELGRLLIGSTVAVEHPLVSALLAGAPDELAMLTGMCRGNLMRTMTTTVSILVFLAQHLKRRDEEPEEPEEGDGLDEADGEPDGAEMVRRAFDAISEQGAVLDDLNQLLPDLGWGFGRGHLESVLLQDMARFTELLQRSSALRQIAAELGRLEQTQRRRPKPPRGGRDDLVGVRVGGALSEVLPTELALLASHDTEDLFYQRYIDQRLLSLEYRGALADTEERRGGEGPVIACVDTSGSMSGVPEVLAKALVLAVMRRVLPRGRRVRLMLFGGPGEFEDRDIGRGPGAMRHFLDFLAMSFHAGTDFDGPLVRALDLLDEARYEQADILVITDGYASASRPVVERVQRLRRELGFSVVSVVIGGSPRGVVDFSDRVWTIPAGEGALDDIALSEWDPTPDP
ncbi:MAG: hypothetical protein ACI8S6_002389 [Myxococcota bacterium]